MLRAKPGPRQARAARRSLVPCEAYAPREAHAAREAHAPLRAKPAPSARSWHPSRPMLCATPGPHGKPRPRANSVGGPRCKRRPCSTRGPGPERHMQGPSSARRPHTRGPSFARSACPARGPGPAGGPGPRDDPSPRLQASSGEVLSDPPSILRGRPLAPRPQDRRNRAPSVPRRLLVREVSAERLQMRLGQVQLLDVLPHRLDFSQHLVELLLLLALGTSGGGQPQGRETSSKTRPEPASAWLWTETGATSSI